MPECVMCGAPAKEITLGWIIVPLCETCHDQEAERITKEWDDFHSGPASHLADPVYLTGEDS
jgi:hypothetical protein